MRGRKQKHSDEVIAALLYVFTPYSVEQATGVKWTRHSKITPECNYDIVEQWIDNPKLKRRRLEYPELLDMLILKSRGLTDREIQAQLSFGAHDHGGISGAIETILNDGYSLPHHYRSTDANEE